MGLPRAAWKLPTWTFGASSRVNVSGCSEPTLFRPGGSYVTIMTGPPPRVAVSNATTERRASGFRLQPSRPEYRFAEGDARARAPGRLWLVRK
jgi:hypothetical protein